MNRVNYQEDATPWEFLRYRGAVLSAIKGKRGQKLLKDLLEAFDSMQIKELVANELQGESGVCTLGCIAKAKGMDWSNWNDFKSDIISKELNIAKSLVNEIAFENDEICYFDKDSEKTRKKRWQKMRTWVERKITKFGDKTCV